MTRDSFRFEWLIPWNRSRLSVAAVILLGLLTKSFAQEPRKQPPFTPNPKLAEIIREVQKNEALYENLETEQRKVKQLELKENPNKWSVTRVEEQLQTVRQGDLIYYRGSKQELRLGGDVESSERVSAFDGEHTRTVDYGLCANIHDGRYESQYVYPPHCWALFDQRVNFPLSVLLQGTEAIHAHPKAHRYDQEKGSVFEFNRFEAEYAGEEEVNGLKCVKILCRHWYYTIRNGKPSKSLIWLAPERNYLCVKRQPIPRDAKQPPGSFTIVDSFREIADSIWLPERVRVLDYYYEDLKDGKQTIEWKDTLELVSAKLNSERPVRFFSDIEIPQDLPVYHITDGRLAGPNFRDRPPTADSEERVQEIIKKIRTEEEHYKNLELFAEEIYRKPDVGIVGTAWGAEIGLMKTLEHSVQKDGKRWYTSEATSRGVDGGTYKSLTEKAYDGEWERTLHAYSNTQGGETTETQYAGLQREQGKPLAIHLPHMMFLHYGWETRAFSEHLASPEYSLGSKYRHRIEYLGEDERDGLRCVVLREVKWNKESDEVLGFGLMWLAVDRNYLRLRSEWYANPQDLKLPTTIRTANDWREVAPGVWFPFHLAHYSIEDWGQENVWVGRMLIQHVTTLDVSQVTIDPNVDDKLFQGSEVPAGTKVSVRSETGNSLGEFELEEDGPLVISEEKYVEMLEAKNELEREKE